MWGDDYPHAEGTWPHTRESMALHVLRHRPEARRGSTSATPRSTCTDLDRAEAAGRSPTGSARPSPILATPCTPPEDEAPGLYAFRTGPGTSPDEPTPPSVAAPCRSVTADEIEHLHEHGWVKLKAFVDPDVARRRARAGPRGRWATTPTATRCPRSSRRPWPRASAGLEYFNAHRSRRPGEPGAAAADRRGRQERRSDAAAPGTADGVAARRPLLPGPLRAEAARRRRRRATAATARPRSTRTSSPSPSTGPAA